MKKASITLLLGVILSGLFASAGGKVYVKDELRRIGNAYGLYINEITGSSVKMILPPVSGQSYVIKYLKYQVNAACKIYTMQAATSPINTTAAVSTYVTMPVQLGQYGSDTSSTQRYLEKGNGLYIWASADPNEGWYEVEYKLFNPDAITQ